MVEGEDWLFRPVARGFLDPVHIYDGTMSLDGIAMLNEMIDVLDENTYREHKAAENKAPQGGRRY